MTFQNIPNGESVFLDANTFVYHFGPDPLLGPPCMQLLNQIELGNLQGFTSAHVLSELTHRLMGIEAQNLFGWPPAGMAQRLKHHPPNVKQLIRYRRALDEISLMGIKVLPTSGFQVSRGADLTRQYGLLANDALVIAVMQANGLTHLASNDADFDRVSGIARYAPT